MEFGVQQKKNQVLAPMRLETAKKKPQPVRKMLHNNNARRPSLVVNSLFPHSASHIDARMFWCLDLVKFLKIQIGISQELFELAQ